MQGLQALSPVAATPAPGRKLSQTPESGSQFASELDSQEARTPETAEPADKGDTEAAPEAAAAAAVTDEPAQPDEPAREVDEDLVDLDWLMAEDSPAPEVALALDGLPEAEEGLPPTRALDVSQGKSAGKAAETVADGPAKPADLARAFGEARPADGVPADRTEASTKGPAPTRQDMVRSASVSEIALNAGLRAAAAAGGQAGTPSSEDPVATEPRLEAAIAGSKRADSRPGEAQGLAVAQAALTESRPARSPGRDRGWGDSAALADAPKSPPATVVPSVQTAVTTAVAAQSNAAMNLLFLASDAAPQADLPMETELLGLGPTGGSEGSGRLAGPGVPAGPQGHGPAVAQQIAAQIGAQITRQGGGTTEIVLDPQELGRVSLSLSTQDGAITVAIAAERPETADLIRRHMDGLSQELRLIGYANVNVGFADHTGHRGKGQGSARNEASGHDTTDITAAAAVAQAPTGRPGLAGGGLDIRL